MEDPEHVRDGSLLPGQGPAPQEHHAQVHLHGVFHGHARGAPKDTPMAPPPLQQRPPQWHSWPGAIPEQPRPPPPWQENRQSNQRHPHEMASRPPLPLPTPTFPDPTPTTLAEVFHTTNAASASQNECISLLAHHVFGNAPPEEFRQALTTARELVQRALISDIPGALPNPQTVTRDEDDAPRPPPPPQGQQLLEPTVQSRRLQRAVVQAMRYRRHPAQAA